MLNYRYENCISRATGSMELSIKRITIRLLGLHILTEILLLSYRLSH
jgi:hypothetical protein